MRGRDSAQALWTVRANDVPHALKEHIDVFSFAACTGVD
jgi:hypothetical protein